MAYLASPSRNAMSVPGRMGTWMSAISAEAERSGSTAIQSAPASRTLDPAKGERLTCGNIGTQSEQAARVRDIAPEHVGLGDAEGRGDTGCEGTPTESRFGVDVHHAPGSQRLGEQELLLSHKARAAEGADGPSAHDRHAAGTLPGAVVVVAVASSP